MKSDMRPTRRELQAAIRNGQFVPFYQPQIDLVSGQPVGVEILGRWAHPRRGLLLPDQFIPLMERYALIDQLTECLLTEALACAKGCAASRNELGFALNVSLISLRDTGLARRICGMLRESGLEPHRITIEVTETAPPDKSGNVIHALACLRTQGFKVSADDFGTGYSSLKLLSQVPFTALKIDRTFVNKVHARRKAAAIVESITHLAGKLGLGTVAEGIETEEEAAFLRALGCETGQGYLLARPMSGCDLARFLEMESVDAAT